MKIEYSDTADAIYVSFKEAFVAKSKEIEEGVVVDLDENGHLIGIEILDVSERYTLADIANVNIENMPLNPAQEMATPQKLRCRVKKTRRFKSVTPTAPLWFASASEGVCAWLQPISGKLIGEINAVPEIFCPVSTGSCISCGGPDRFRQGMDNFDCPLDMDVLGGEQHQQIWNACKL